MEPSLYKAAAEGNIEPFKEIAKDDLQSMVTPNKNTILHIHIASQRQNKEGESMPTAFVEGILERCPSLLVPVNANGDAPLHVAAKRGHPSVVEVLIEFAKNQPKNLESGVETARQILGMTNEEQNTALHEAVHYNSLDVVKLLMKTDPDFPYSTNGSSQTPLYIAAARGSGQMVVVILENCPSAAHEGPNGENALHVAVRNLYSRGEGIEELLLEKKKSLSRERDQHGWTPLHHATYLGNDYAISLLLRYDDASNTTCIGDKERKMTALHLAASQGYRWTTGEIIRLCPECCDMVDDRGWNILHFAMVSMDSRDLRELLEAYPILTNLMNEKDVKGNTPLHLLAALRQYSSYATVPLNSKGDFGVVNKQNISVQQIIYNGYPELKTEIEELSKDVGSGRQYYKGVISIRRPDPVVSQTNDDLDDLGLEKIRESHLIVATLIATVSFAAAFTIPGGYNSSDGIAILRKNKAFQAFIISDTIAMLLSLSAVFIHFLTSIQPKPEDVKLLSTAFYFTMISMGAMVTAFVTGTYAMLAPSSCLAIVTCLIALSTFFVGVFVFDYHVHSRFGVHLIKHVIKTFF